MHILNLVLGPIEGLFLLLALGLFALKVFAFVDALVRPRRFWDAAGENKTLWLVLLGLAVLFGQGLGILGIAALVATIVYLVDRRAKVREIQRGGPSGPYGSGPFGGGRY